MKPILTTPAILVTGLLFILAPAVYASEHEHREHAAHEHGAATMNVAIEENQLLIELESPAMNIVGFEHMPRNNKQQQEIKSAVKKLKNANSLFGLPAKATCQLTSSQVETPLLDTNQQHDAHNDHKEKNHSEFHAAYVFQCANIRALDSIDVQLFRQFKATEEIRVQAISGKGQTSVELTAHQHKLTF